MVSEIKLAEMLCTRLCHDLTGPIGAVNNGAEFLSEEGFDMHNEAMQLVLSSAHEAVNRLQFYRQAYGRVNDHGEASLTEKRTLAQAFFASTKLKLDWPDAHADGSGVSVSQKMSRLLLNSLILMAGALIRGGTISIRVSEDANERHIEINGEGETVKSDPETMAIIRGEGSEALLSPKTSQAFLTAKLANELDATMEFDVSEHHFRIHVRQPVVVAQLVAN